MKSMWTKPNQFTNAVHLIILHNCTHFTISKTKLQWVYLGVMRSLWEVKLTIIISVHVHVQYYVHLNSYSLLECFVHSCYCQHCHSILALCISNQGLNYQECLHSVSLVVLLSLVLEEALEHSLPFLHSYPLVHHHPFPLHCYFRLCWSSRSGICTLCLYLASLVQEAHCCQDQKDVIWCTQPCSQSLSMHTCRITIHASDL